LKRLWETSGRGQEDLLLAARLAQVLERYDEAEEYTGLALSGGDPVYAEALAGEKAKILYARGRRTELRDYLEILKTRKPSAPQPGGGIAGRLTSWRANELLA
jgi:tetratricopeptide (TPR) repeat protein